MDNSLILSFDPLFAGTSTLDLPNGDKENVNPADMSISEYFSQPYGSYSNPPSQQPAPTRRRGKLNTLVELSDSMDLLGQLDEEEEETSNCMLGSLIDFSSPTSGRQPARNSPHPSPERIPLTDITHSIGSLPTTPLKKSTITETRKISTPSSQTWGSPSRATNMDISHLTSISTARSPYRSIEPSSMDTVGPSRLLTRTPLEPLQTSTTFPSEAFPSVSQDDQLILLVPDFNTSLLTSTSTRPDRINTPEITTLPLDQDLPNPKPAAQQDCPPKADIAHEPRRVSLDLNSTFDLRTISDASFDLLKDEISFLGSSKDNDESLLFAANVPNVFTKVKDRKGSEIEISDPPSQASTAEPESNTRHPSALSIITAINVPLPCSPVASPAVTSPSVRSPLRNCILDDHLIPAQVPLPASPIPTHIFTPTKLQETTTRRRPTHGTSASLSSSILSRPGLRSARPQSQLVTQPLVTTQASRLGRSEVPEMKPILSSRAAAALASSGRSLTSSRLGKLPSSSSRLGSSDSISKQGMPPPRLPRTSVVPLNPSAKGESKVTQGYPTSSGVSSRATPLPKSRTLGERRVPSKPEVNASASQPAETLLAKSRSMATLARSRASTVSALPRTQTVTSLQRSQTPITQTSARTGSNDGLPQTPATRLTSSRPLSRHASRPSISGAAAYQRLRAV